MNTTSAINPGSCPLCGQPNGCGNLDKVAVSTENDTAASRCSGDSHCWCQDSQISFPAALCEQVAEPLRRKACICRHCAEGFQQR